MKNLVVSLLLISFSFVAFAGETFTACWVPNPPPNEKTAKWVDPCPDGLLPHADYRKGLNIHQSDGSGVGNPPPNENTAKLVKPRPSGSFREVTPQAALPTPQPNKLSVGGGDPLKGLNIASEWPNGCWVANPPPNENTAKLVKPCPY